MAPPFPSPTAKWHSTAYDSISPTRPELSAKGKAVVVTGGGTGIGAETARSFAAAGASRIALFGRRQQPLDETKASIEKEFGHVEVFVASTDITIQAQVDAAFDQFGKNGKIDVLISNAGVSGPLGSIGTLDVKEFMDGVNANIGGNLIVAQAFLRHAAKGATVVNVNSAAAHVNMGPGFASYCVSKMGVFRLWDSVAFKSPDLRVFHVQPGVVDTEMNRQAGGVKALGYEDHVSLPACFNVWLASEEADFVKKKFLYSSWDVDELLLDAISIASSRRFNIDLVGWPFGDKMEATWKS